MTVGKISAACWTFFVIMCVAFLPLGLGIMQLHAVPAAARVVLAIVVVGGLLWGPFAYAMYLSIAVLRNGDRRLLKRGIRGTAEVLSAKRTRTVIQEGEFDAGDIAALGDRNDRMRSEGTHTCLPRPRPPGRNASSRRASPGNCPPAAAGRSPRHMNGPCSRRAGS